MFKSRLLIITFEFYPVIGGAGSNAANMALGLTRLGCDVEVLTYKFGQDFQDFDLHQPYNIIRLSSKLPNSRQSWVAHASRLGWWLARNGRNYDCILLADWVADAMFNMTYCMLRIPFSVYVHGSEINAFKNRPRLRLLTKRLYKRANACLCNSLYTSSLLKKSFPEINKKNIYIVNVAVNFPDLRTVPSQRVTARKALGLDQKTFVLFQLSRIVDRKGHKQVIKALAAMSKEERSSLVYLIGGSGSETEYLRDLARRFKLEERVRFIGRVASEELPAYYDACDLFIMPSLEARNRVEGFGAVYVEAALRRKPSVGSWHGAVPEVVLDGETGLLADPEDPHDLKEKILRLRDDSVLRKRMGLAAEARAQSNFSLGKVSRRVALCLDLKCKHHRSIFK
ncbi:MAG: glycosyltransferase family 4 protein [Desulfarculaceae bacterium]|nr:glycosyltransferase family 4 protein [Desulfarculaceae bacterium]MCF8118285.1 glycosyltransferase family 4 protein [Desulfarculaceae bacterium]